MHVLAPEVSPRDEDVNLTLFSLLNEHVALRAAKPRPSVSIVEVRAFEDMFPRYLPKVHPESALVSSVWYAKSSEKPTKSQLSEAIF